MPAQVRSRLMWHMVLLAIVGALLLLAGAGRAEAEGTSFRDDFDSFDSSMWIRSSHAMGLTDLEPTNAVVGNGQLRLRLEKNPDYDPANTAPGAPKPTLGAEIESMEYYGYGTYKARIRTADAPSSITGFYLYRSPDLYAEIDIEIYNDGTGKVDFVTYAGGQRTHYVGKDFRFDPSAEFHTYRFDYNPGNVKFYVDGDPKQVWTDGIPDAWMKLLVNAWYPDWLPGTVPSTATATRVDWISYEQM